MTFLLRGNSEARCEPDLRARYDLTERFYDLFDDTEEMRTYPELVDLYGDIRFPVSLLRKPVIGRVLFAGSRRRGTVSGRDVASEGWR